VDERAFLDRTGHRLPHALVAALDDELGGALVDARLVSLGRLTPGGDRMGVALAALALAAAVRVIDRVHGKAAHGGAPALPAVPAGLADADDLVLGVAELADGGPALEEHAPHLGRGHADLRVLASFAISCPKDPALRMSCAPRPRLSSTLWITVPSGMAWSGSAFPGRMSTLSPDCNTSPTFTPTGQGM